MSANSGRRPQDAADDPATPEAPSAPGAIRVAPGHISLNADRSVNERLRVVVENTGDRPIQIGSHLHLPDANAALAFDRELAQGYRLDIPSGTSVRFEPGVSREVALVALRGERRVPGLQIRDTAASFGDTSQADAGGAGESHDDIEPGATAPHGTTSHPEVPAVRPRPSEPTTITRDAYAALYGPTTGDQIRLGDTDLWIEVEHDHTVGGEEAVFGGGKSIRESMAQGLTTRAGGALDTVITNVVVLDHWGVVRADVGIRDGRIVALGHSGNPDVADGVHPDLHIGPGTDPPQHRPPDGRLRPPGFMSVGGGHDSFRAGCTCGVAQQCQGSGSPEPDGGYPAGGNQSRHDSPHRPGRKNRVRGNPHHLVAETPVVGGTGITSGLGGCQYREVFRRHSGGKIPDIGLDAADGRRKIVGDDQNMTHARKPYRQCPAGELSSGGPRSRAWTPSARPAAGSRSRTRE